MSYLFFLLWYFLFIYNNITNAYCPDDKDLQHHQCICSLTDNYIQCSSLPNQCRTCYRYKAIIFDEKVNILPVEAFRFYDFFENDKKFLFKIQFTQLNNLSSKSFSKMNIIQGRTLNIKILKYSSSILPTKVFEDIKILSKSKVNIEIYNVTSTILTIKQHALDGIKFHHKSQFRLLILHAKDTIQFESNAGSIQLPSYSYMELYFANFIQVVLNEHSFNHIKQEYSSKLIIKFDRFQYATFSHNSFFDFHQSNESRFHLSLLNFQNLKIEQTLFDRIIQLKSYLIISIYNLTNDLCLLNKTFNQIKQDFNSTFQFEINYGQNLLLTSNSFININQKLQSKLSIIIINSLDVYFSHYALNNIYQEDQSLIDISIKYGQNLIFDDYAINNMYIYHSSILRIGFQHSRGTLQMAMNAFSNINEGQSGRLIFQIMNSSNFYFRFNQTSSLERIEIIDRSLSSNDFCRISNIPSHILVKLLFNNQCSCTIYYLYRYVYRKLLQSTTLKDLTPFCYSNMSFDDIEYLENECLFKNKINNCQQIEGEIQINIPQGICQENLKLNQKNKLEKNLSLKLILIIFGCLIFSITCIYILFSNNRRSSLWNLIPKYFHRYRYQKLLIFSTDSDEQLTPIDQQESNNKIKRIIVMYNAITEQIQPYFATDEIDFISSNDNRENRDITFQINTNPMNEIEDNNTLEITQHR
ncbi:unnamed protein product [Rotaria sordida]|uniref:Transmembrane protein n=1 Tax=Rotaria sordida TaxID=392033 RepID=A0A815JW63_9BILA|nr:unnamed protein product [Rotaria sordida]CAF4130606.1 unnamed protein product [Rotaria sordida]